MGIQRKGRLIEAMRKGFMEGVAFEIGSSEQAKY